jgi:UDP-glucose 4-epimerase
VLVTGGDGFIGSAACRALSAAGHRVRRAVRRAAGDPATTDATGVVAVGDIGAQTDWGGALAGIDAVIHLAGRVHVMREPPGDALARFRAVNVAGTRRLAESAACAGVQRIVYVSSIKVNGETTADTPFRETDAPAPLDPYGVSKWEAEETLRGMSERHGLEAVIVRPPLVYGPGVRGNLRALLRAIARGIPLPLGGIRNRRSLVGLENLVQLLVRCTESSAAAGETFLAADGEDVSTPDLVRQLAAGVGRPARLFAVPEALAAGAAALLGWQDAIARLWGSLQIDASKARSLLEWHPRVRLAEGLRRTGEGYRP